MTRLALKDVQYYDKDTLLSKQSIIITNGVIEAIVPNDSLDPSITTHHCHNQLLAAGFIDTQVNGGGGIMFNSDPSVETLDRMRRAHWSGGTTAMLPTLITDSDAKMQQAVHAVAQALPILDGIIGIHLEGPHINPARRGAHAADIIRPFSAHTEALLTILPPERYLLTVAPEQLPSGTIQQLREKGVHVNAGHTAANYQQIKAALVEGLSGFTHLYNAMTPITGREPGVVGAALEDEHSYCGMIIDGHHLHAVTAKLAIHTKKRGKILLITDAMSTVGSDQTAFELYGETIRVVDGCCVNSNGSLAGSALDMASAVRNCVRDLAIPLSEALRMASLYPAQFLGLADDYGSIAVGKRADLVLLNHDLHVKQTWVGGELCFDILPDLI